MEKLAYVRRWFLEKRQFALSIGISNDAVDQLTAAGAMPGIIYAPSVEGWWSALAAARGEVPAAPPEEGWYSPAAAWWGRRAVLSMRGGGSVESAAAGNRNHFIATFIEALGKEPHAMRAFASCFHNGTVNPGAASEAAAKEWADWIGGAYAICLRRFSAESCIRKESLARRLRDYWETEDDLSDMALLDLVEQLEGLMLPFAPWERSSGTPGRVVDKVLTLLRVGRELPYADIES